MISVCIPTYNGEKFLKPQIDSVLSQLSQKDEIVVSDDGSSDNTIEILENYKDSRIKIFCNPRKGVISNIENVLQNSIGEYIFLCDQDDVWVENKVSKMMTAMAESDLVISDCYVTDQNLNTIYESFYKQNNSRTNKWLALLKNPYLGCCMAFKRKILNAALPFPSKIPMHDIWIGNVAAFKFHVKFIPDKLIYYRRHGNNASTASAPTKASLIKQINYRLPVISGLLKLK
ncbi:MAG: glycosyltransferase family 2 protein [Paludibacteraceae bacterium]|nr:glycosyltransferase family 2 protein [Paludibacteraceae bacterium]